MAGWFVSLVPLLLLPLYSGLVIDGVDCHAVLQSFEEQADVVVWQDFGELVMESGADHSLEQQCELLLTHYRYEEVIQDLDPEEANVVAGMAAPPSCWWADFLSYPESQHPVPFQHEALADGDRIEQQDELGPGAPMPMEEQLIVIDGVDCLALLHSFEEQADDGVWQDFGELVLEHGADHSLEQQCELLLTHFRYEEVTQDLDPEEANVVDGMAAPISCSWADFLSYPEAQHPGPLMLEALPGEPVSMELQLMDGGVGDGQFCSGLGPLWLGALLLASFILLVKGVGPGGPGARCHQDADGSRGQHEAIGAAARWPAARDSCGSNAGDAAARAQRQGER